MTTQRPTRRLSSLAAALLIGLAGAGTAHADVLIDNATTGYYNAGIGTLLNGTSSAFPTNTDPVLNFNTAPDLSAAATQLGDWLAPNPTLTTPGATWSASPMAIPSTWTVGTETAILYTLGGPNVALQNVVVSIGVDNGVFAWLDGVFLGGFLRPGGASPGEHVFNLGNLSAGTHRLQILREDHGGLTGWTILANGTPVVVPEPSSVALSLIGMAAAAVFAGLRRKDRHRLT